MRENFGRDGGIEEPYWAPSMKTKDTNAQSFSSTLEIFHGKVEKSSSILFPYCFLFFVDLQSLKVLRDRRQAVSTSNATKAKSQKDTSMLKISKLLSDLKTHLCQSKGVTCSSGPPGPPGPAGPSGQKGARGRRGQKGRTGNKGDKGIMGSPGKSGNQGIMGPMGPQGQAGPKGQKGDTGSAGMPGAKGEPGESISAPVVVVSPARLTVNESGTASFQCSASGNPEPAVVWSKLNSQSAINQSDVSGETLRLRNVKGSSSGVYQCLAANILGKSRAVAQLVVNGKCHE